MSNVKIGKQERAKRTGFAQKIVYCPRSNTYITTLPGNYKCIVTTGICSIASNKIKLTLLLRLSDIENTSLNIYPNPAHDVLFIQFEEGISDEIVRITLTDVLGNLLSENIHTETQGPLKISLPAQIASGTYLISVTGNTTSFTSTIIIE
ncbi:MAG: T9SS type A sorting domain-containing protein [Fimbriimonadaceae bacterium]|nr:T9SS type A sorting domain-containing protein [Chitinophagales bacterium]